jgi:hypothetical protein
MRPKAEGLPTRSDVLPEIDVALEALSRPLTRQEREAGWSDESRIALRSHLEIAKARLLDPRPLQAEEFPPDWQTLRGLDAWGIDVARASPLRETFLGVSSELRRVLAGELRKARHRSV